MARPLDGPPLEAGNHERLRAWWPGYNLAVSAGLGVCVALTAYPLTEIVLADTPIGGYLPYLRGLLMEAASSALMLSTIYYFLFGYLAGMVRLGEGCAGASSAVGFHRGLSVTARARIPEVTKPTLYLIIMLSFLGFVLWAGWPHTVPEILWIILIFLLPLTLFRSPWAGNRRRPLAAIVPHTYVV